MKKLLLTLAFMGMSATTFATTFNCGVLKYRGKPVRGGIVYQIQTSNQKVFLLSTPLSPVNRGLKPLKSEMKLVYARPELQKFALGDLDATLIYNIHTRQTDVTLEKASNKDWATSCSQVATKK